MRPSPVVTCSIATHGTIRLSRPFIASDGDMPLDITAVGETTALARSHMVATGCVGGLPPGSSCSITIYYDPSRLAYPTGLMYDTLTVMVQSDALQTATFSSRFTIRVRVGDND